MTTVVEKTVGEPAAPPHLQYTVPTHGRETRAAGSVTPATLPGRLGNGKGLGVGAVGADGGDGLLAGELLIDGLCETSGVAGVETAEGLLVPVQLAAASIITRTKTEALRPVTASLALLGGRSAQDSHSGGSSSISFLGMSTRFSAKRAKRVRRTGVGLGIPRLRWHRG